MGKKMSWETAQQLAGRKTENNSIYAPENKYGYKININHPEIRPLYERYKDYFNTPILSDKQRFDFEDIIFRMIEREKNEQVNASRQTDSRPRTETDPERNRFV